MPTIDNWRALREALDAGPTDKPWSLEPVEDRSIKHLCPVDADGLSILTVVTHDDTPFAAVYLDADAHYIAAAHPAAIRSLLDERDRLEKALALVQQHHATAWNRGHTIGMAAQEETARKALDAVKADAWGNAQLTEALLAAEAERDRLAAEQHVMRQWIAEVLPVLGSIDSEGKCHAVNSKATLQFLLDLEESGRLLVDGGPDDLLAGVE